ncbi:MAG: beta-lactamase family protein [Saprospiraceae bacterium]|nr:beta-lactamase family protein [Saprospiraceae bacterium]
MDITSKLSHSLVLAVLSSLVFFPIQAITQIDSLKLDTMHQLIEKGHYPNIHSVLVQQSGDLKYEAYFGGYTADSLHDTRSAFKSVTSLLVGIALDKGYIESVDVPLLHFFPDFTPEDARKKEISLRHLLEMKGGFRVEEFYGIGPYLEDEMWETDDWVKYSLEVPMKDTPGLNFSYNSCEPVLVGAALSHAVGKSIMDFSEEHLFAPLGIKDYRWTITPKGYGMTAGSFFMKPRDMVKLGELVLREGNWQGQSIISSPWINTSTRCLMPIDFSFVRYSRMDNAQVQSSRYGYYWYKERLRYQDIDTVVLFASGNGGQYIMILPDWDMVVVFTGGNYSTWRGKLPLEILLKFILPSFEKPGKN